MFGATTPPKEKPKADEALWLWGRLKDFERDGAKKPVGQANYRGPLAGRPRSRAFFESSASCSSRAFAMFRSVSPALFCAQAILNLALQSSKSVPCPLSPLHDGWP